MVAHLCLSKQYIQGIANVDAAETPFSLSPPLPLYSVSTSYARCSGIPAHWVLMSTLSPAAAAAAQAALEIAVGPLLVTLCLAFVLFGVFLAQFYYYFTHYENDGVQLRSFVGVIGLLETLHSALCIHVLYDYFVTHYGNPAEGISKIVWYVAVITAIGCGRPLTDFYIRRIWYLSEKNIFAVIAPTLLLCARDGELVCWVLRYKYKLWAVFRGHADANRIVEATFSLGLVADVTITGTLIYYLGFNRSGFAFTNKKLQTLVHYTASTGALTVKIENSLLFGGLIEFISKLYANSMLAMSACPYYPSILSTDYHFCRLNARNKIRSTSGPERSSAAYEFSTSIRTEPYHPDDSRPRFTPTESAYSNTMYGDTYGYGRNTPHDALSDVTKMGDYHKASLDKLSQPSSPIGA
ncbi:hypothetical protein BC629DRAFT_1525328 [Irpex lacteus]|nr:hypothetical protein BC629DRAFT_1525328 [Irpex lacteus]